MKKMKLMTTIAAAILALTPLYAGEKPAKEVPKEKEVKVQTTCPVMGGKINSKLFVDTDGKRIYVCCPGCVAAIKKDPAKYIKKLEDGGVTVALTPKKVEGKQKNDAHAGHKH